ncbi:MAG: hypothetical protein JWN95_3884 [Frankiales bacterium]|nr:hypothetical protein [Frankiales bacterium]
MTAHEPATVLTALDTSQVKSLGIVAIVVIVLIGLLIARLVTKIITRIIVLVVMVLLAGGLYQQRDRVTAAADDAKKSCDITFFGVHVTPSNPDIKKECIKIANK